jgi:NO-binding membrane sensor protein with MHYT domain
VAEIHHFTYGVFNPVAAFALAFLGSMLGLAFAARARAARTRGRWVRWLLIAAVAIGGIGIWLMHFMGMLGFEVPGSPTRYDPVLTLLSSVLAVIPVAVGLLVVGRGRPSAARIAGGGVFTGLGVLAMHYTGMLGVRVAGTVEFDPGLVGASAVIAVVAAAAALWFTTMVDRWGARVLAATSMAFAVVGMHYTGMAALRVRPAVDPVVVDGLRPFALIVPITVLSAVALLAMAITALQAMTEEEFGGETTGRHRDTGSSDTGNSHAGGSNTGYTDPEGFGGSGPTPDRVPERGLLAIGRAAPRG